MTLCNGVLVNCCAWKGVVEGGGGGRAGQRVMGAWVCNWKLSKINKSLKLFFCPHCSYMQT